jgi:hypothetical protein
MTQQTQSTPYFTQIGKIDIEVIVNGVAIPKAPQWTVIAARESAIETLPIERRGVWFDKKGKQLLYKLNGPYLVQIGLGNDITYALSEGEDKLEAIAFPNGAKTLEWIFTTPYSDKDRRIIEHWRTVFQQQAEEGFAINRNYMRAWGK